MKSYYINKIYIGFNIDNTDRLKMRLLSCQVSPQDQKRIYWCNSEYEFQIP